MSIFNLKSQIRLTCPKRISPWLKQETETLGYKIVSTDDTGLVVNGTLRDCMKLNLWLRTAHRVLFLLDEYEVGSPEDLYENLTHLPWEEYIPADGYVSVSSTVDHPSVNDTRFPNMKTKDAIVDRINSRMGRRPDSGPDDSRSAVYLYWKGDSASIYLDTSGETIARHSYRKNPFKAPMQETLAAAVVYATGWDGKTPFVNPMCGSGTLAIEAAMIGINKAPGLLRSNYGFMHLVDYNSKDWSALRKEADSAITELSARIVATDIDGEALRASEINARAAGVAHLIDFREMPFEQTPLPPGNGVMIFNPEYGERLGDEESLEPIYTQIGDFMKKRGEGYRGYVFTGNMELAKKIGLKASRRLEFYNSTIDCRLLEFELYEGTRRESFR